MDWILHREGGGGGGFIVQNFVNITEVRLPVGRHCPLPESVVISWNSQCLPFSVACIEFVLLFVAFM